MMKVYIAGKIAGDDNYKAKFAEAEQQLIAQGNVPINPAMMPEGLSSGDYMRVCFAMMDGADVVLFLPDYQNSRGAMLEWQWCQYVGKQTAYNVRQLANPDA